MKKALVGLVAIGAIIALRPVMRRLGRRMRKHCEQMAAQFVGRADMSRKMPGCCEEMGAQSEGRAEAAQEMGERGEQVAASSWGRATAATAPERSARRPPGTRPRVP